MRQLTSILFVGLALALAACNPGFSQSAAAPDTAAALKQYQNGNYKDAYDLFRQVALDPRASSAQACEALPMGVACLQSLGRSSEIDDFREAVVALHANNWRLLMTAAQNYLQGEHSGFIVSGKFERGHHRGGGKYVNSFERDRGRALQLMEQALKASKDEPDRVAVGELHLQFAQALLWDRGQSDSWRLQYLSDLAKLPDYEEGHGYYYGRRGAAPVDADGNPVLYRIPKSYEDAQNDGERWRWMLIQALELAPGRNNEILNRFATFLRDQFDVHTMADYGRYFMQDQDDTKKDESGPYAVQTLADDETIARLATGIKRFKLSDEFNYIRIFRQIADNSKTGYGENALQNLAQIFENRRQYNKALECWQRNIKEYGPGDNNWKRARVDQISGNWGAFEPVSAHPAGQGATVEFRFRNATHVTFEAHAIQVKTLLDDVKAYLKSNPRNLDWSKMNIGDIGYTLVQNKGEKYIGAKAASWELDLKPREGHFDRRITVETPLKKPGAYWLTAKVSDGNVSRIIIWVEDTVIVKKILDRGSYYFVADAVNGEPVAKANLEFFGYRQEAAQNLRGAFSHYNVITRNFAEFSDESGQFVFKKEEAENRYQWIITATTGGGRFAYLGFTGIWYGHYHDQEYNQTKVYLITDRPVYRPAQKVHFKFWVRHAKYDQEDTSSFAGQSFTIQLNNPKGEKVLEKQFAADKYGGFEGEYDLPKGADLGQYYLQVINVGGGGSFRVEEYKKPEFEVSVSAPTEPVMLGEKITATIKAKYYFGSPVTSAKVKYKVMRSDHSANWYPHDRWDWFYGNGYWWFASDYTWYPGWKSWGCPHPCWWWWPARRTPPEVVAENEVAIGSDGTVPVVIDTALAKAVHGDSDHRYEITAEVVDASRRTIVGNGTVLVAREPFKVYAWTDRGYYRVGDTVRADFSVHTLDGKPVAGTGSLKLLKISYDRDSKPVEKCVEEWNLDPDSEGHAMMQVKAAKGGQYRLAYSVTDARKHTIEGAYLFCVMGEGFESSGYRFNNIELVADKKNYAPGEKVRLMINTDRKGGTVLFFARPANGVYLAPRIIRLKGKSTLEEIEVSKKDMPNFFVEALTISDGKIYNEMREIVVPPEQRVLNVDVLPSTNSYKPGEKAAVKFKVTDSAGKPFLGAAVVAIYDKAVEYISGGSNVPEIKAFFWKWRRHHNPSLESSLERHFYNLLFPKELGMQDLGVFGRLAADEDLSINGPASGRGGGKGGGVREHARKMSAAKQAVGGEMREEGAVLGMAMPSAPMGAVMEARADGFAMVDAQDKDGGIGEGQEVVQPTIRSQFADTALWKGDLLTDENGTAEVQLTMPENLTTWKIRTWAMGHGTRVGEGSAEVVTTKKLLLRLQAPRFFVEKDEVVLSANIHNYLAGDKSVRAVLELEGGTLAAIDKTTQTIQVKANGEQRVDWRVSVTNEGEAVIRMKVLSDEESDAMEMRFPVYVHGMLKTESFSGAIAPDKNKASFDIRVPKERRVDQSRLEIRYSPTLAGAMVDALPYLASYPYGCTEQTLNRFLPTVLTQKILIQMGVDLKAVREKQSNLNAQEIGDDKERAKQWKRWKDVNPVFDKATVEEMVKEGVERLTSMQLSDGGWGWFSGWGEHSSAHLTATVVHGLQVARENDVAIVPDVMERGVEWLKNCQDEQIRLLKNAPSKKEPYKTSADNLDAFVFMVLVDSKADNAEMREFLYRDRNHLSVYAKAMIGLAFHKTGQKEKLDMIMQNIGQFVVEDDENQTAYLKLPENNWWWCWYGSENEAQAYYLKLLSLTDPKGSRAPRLVKYMLNNRKHATYWNSTRDTALCVEAFADYIRASGEDKPDMTVEIYVDQKKRKEVAINKENLFFFDNKLVMFGDAVEEGSHKVEFQKKGTGPLYFNAYLSNFTLEDRITKAGLEVKVNRKFYKLVKADKTIKARGDRGQALDQKVEKYDRQEIADLSVLKSGDLVEIELTIESKNDYEYIVIEDMKAAGFEPVDLRSGYNANDLGAYMELRDERVCFFVRQLARGNHSVAYRVRAEIPGRFSALPTRISAMYAPELKGNSDEMKISIED